MNNKQNDQCEKLEEIYHFQFEHCPIHDTQNGEINFQYQELDGELLLCLDTMSQRHHQEQKRARLLKIELAFQLSMPDDEMEPQYEKKVDEVYCDC